jgi:multicomponent Na+:H+ antiporter subunit D
MQTLTSITPLLAVLVPAGVTALIIVSRRNPNWREAWSVIAAIVTFMLVMSMAPAILAGNVIEFTLFRILPGVDLAFRVDSIGLLFATTTSSLWIAAAFYCIGYMRTLNEAHQTRFYVCFAIAISAALGVAFSANLFTLYLFYEILSICTFPLVIHKETAESWDAGRKYLLYLAGTAKTILLAAIVLTYYLTGTLEFNRGGMFAGVDARTLLTVIYFCFIFGFAKAAIMPVHSWLPAAMVAPTPVSALLHAVAVVKVGAFSVVRVVTDVFGIDLMRDLDLGTWTAIFASITILAASAFALTQDNLKMRLAYSTVSQLSYIVLGVALLSLSGVTGGIVHIINHAFSKITLFFCAGAIYAVSHKTDISQMSGIARKMPWTIAAFTIGSLSMVGVPLFAGFITKWYLAVGSIQTENWMVLGVLLTSTVLNLAYFAPVVYKAVFEAPPEDHDGHEDFGEAPPAILIPLLVTAVGTILLGIFPHYFLGLIRMGFM